MTTAPTSNSEWPRRAESPGRAPTAAGAAESLSFSPCSPLQRMSMRAIPWFRVFEGPSRSPPARLACPHRSMFVFDLPR